MHRRILRALLGAALFWVAIVACASPPPDPINHLPAVNASGAEPIPLHDFTRAWIDALGGRPINEVEAAGDSLPWRHRRAEQADRLDGKALWLQFDLRVAEPDKWFVEVGAAGIDRVQLFYRNSAGAWVVQEAGDSQPISSWPVPGRYPTFALSAEPRPVRYWIRIEHTRLDFAAPVTAYRERTLLAKRDREQFMLGAYFGLAALLSLAALTSGLIYRDRAFLAFAGYIFVVGAAQLARAGFGAEHVWPDWPYWNDMAVVAWPGLPVAAALWFVRVVTEPVHLSRALDLGVIAVVAAILLAVATDAVFQARGTMVLVLVLSGMSIAVLMAMVMWGWMDGRDRDLRLIAVGFLPSLLLAIFPLARGFNLIPMSLLTRYAVFFGTALQMPILYYALQVRSLRRREGQVRAAALSHTDALTGLPHRRTLLERLETTLARVRNSKVQVALLGVRISNLDAIAEEFGREAVDKSLVIAGSHLRRCVTDIDMAARVGERDFALLLEGPVTGPQAVSRAQQVIASGLRQTEQLPAALTLKFHVAIALLPHESRDALASLRYVQEGVDHIGADARKMIKTLNF